VFSIRRPLQYFRRLRTNFSLKFLHLVGRSSILVRQVVQVELPGFAAPVPRACPRAQSSLRMFYLPVAWTLRKFTSLAFLTMLRANRRNYRCSNCTRIHLKLRGTSSCAILCAIAVILGACSLQINCKTFIIISCNLYYLYEGFRLETRGYVIALYVHLILDP